jgi:hypothetical protein
VTEETEAVLGETAPTTADLANLIGRTHTKKAE